MYISVYDIACTYICTKLSAETRLCTCDIIDVNPEMLGVSRPPDLWKGVARGRLWKVVGCAQNIIISYNHNDVKKCSEIWLDECNFVCKFCRISKILCKLYLKKMTFKYFIPRNPAVFKPEPTTPVFK